MARAFALGYLKPPLRGWFCSHQQRSGYLHRFWIGREAKSDSARKPTFSSQFHWRHLSIALTCFAFL